MPRSSLRLALLLAAIVGCGGASPEPAPEVPATPPERIAAFLAERSGPEVPAAPRIGAGDVLRIDAVGVDEANGEYVVPRRGAIRVPFVGDVRVEGRTTDDVVDELVRRLRVVVNEPLVDVRIVERGSAEAVIEGAVESPGRVAIGRRGRTLGDALALAGGLREDASGIVRLVPAVEAPPGLFAEPVADEERAIELSVLDGAEALALHLRPGDRLLALAREGSPAEPPPAPLPLLVPAEEAAEEPAAGAELAAGPDVATPAEAPPSAPREDPQEDPQDSDVPEDSDDPQDAEDPEDPEDSDASPAPAELGPPLDTDEAPAAADTVPLEAPAPLDAEIAEPAPDQAEPLDLAPAEDETFVAGVEDELASVERELEDRIALEREITESRDRVRELEDAVRAERAEAESLRRRLAELEERLEIRDAAIRGAYGDAAPVVSPPAETTSPAEAETEAPPTSTEESEPVEESGLGEGRDEEADEAETEIADEAEPAAEDGSGGGMFGGFFGVFSGDEEEEEPAPTDGEVVEPALADEPAPEARVEIVGSVAKPGGYGLGTARTVSRAIEEAGAGEDANLRAIEVRRPWGSTVWTILVDLEDVRDGRASDLLLVDGDVIVVPALE